MAKRFIEYDLPLAEISEQSAREKTHCVNKVNPRTVGAMRLSANEWKKARHFRDKFWPYICLERNLFHRT